MAGTKRGTFFSGAGLVWKWQRLVWWIFAVCLIFGFFSTQDLAERAAGVMNHSVAAHRLFDRFDFSAIINLTQLPDSPLEVPGHTMIHFSLVFVVFMLFATGGILAAYVLEEKPTTTAFFEAAGHHFWRFFRLTIYLAIVLLPIAGLVAASSAMYTHIDEQSISPYFGDHFAEAAAVVVLLLLIIVRVWFDMAQVIAVADGRKENAPRPPPRLRIAPPQFFLAALALLARQHHRLGAFRLWAAPLDVPPQPAIQCRRVSAKPAHDSRLDRHAPVAEGQRGHLVS